MAANFSPPTQTPVIPSTRIAESLGRVIVQNIVMVGFVAAAAGLAPAEALRLAVEHSVPPGTEELNLSAFDKGFEFFSTIESEAAPDTSDKTLEGVPV